jgi:pimeloyl-ACP methyl ester carboxylesterase
MSSALDSAATPTTSVVSGTVESFDATRIAYDLYDLSSKTLVLVVPGFWRFRRHPSMTSLAARLNALGYSVAVTDPRGHGESGGTYGFNLHEHHDVAAVAKALQSSLSFDGIAVIALSYGGAIAISTVARHPDLPFTSMLLISCVADFGMIVPRINPFTMNRHIAWSQAFHRPRFDWSLRRSRKLSALGDVKDVHVPVDFVHVKDDWLINHGHSEALFAAANEPKELHLLDIPGQFHADRIFNIAEAHMNELMEEWLKKVAPR